MARELVAEGGGAEHPRRGRGGDRARSTATHVSAAAHAGDPDALALVDQYTDNVALGLVGLANILDPE